MIVLLYGKKLGLPEYSSHNFSVSLKTEAASLDQIQDEVERAYHILQQAVDSQITNPGYVPGMEAQHAPSNIVHLPPPASQPSGSRAGYRPGRIGRDTPQTRPHQPICFLPPMFANA